MKNVILKPGSFDPAQNGKNQPGLDLGRIVLNWLVSKKLLVTSDCCAYYLYLPPERSFENEAGAIAAGVPLGGLYSLNDGTVMTRVTP